MDLQPVNSPNTVLPVFAVILNKSVCRSRVDSVRGLMPHLMTTKKRDSQMPGMDFSQRFDLLALLTVTCAS